MRIGLLGGSFNPAHEAHLSISLEALKRLRLDQVWWLVTPGNPLKAGKVPDSETRARQAAALVRDPRIKITIFEQALASRHTVDSLAFLKQRMPGVHFVWLMGADNLAAFHRWKDWREIFALMPVAVFDRPGFRVDQSDAAGLALLPPPAWCLLTVPLSPLSSTALRNGMQGSHDTR
jgi:nicotinate-nucleotide adenylyltransferase